MKTDTEKSSAPALAVDDGSEVFEIANPSDKYTIKGPFMACAIAVAMLGNGAYGIKGTPVLFGWDAWLKEKGIEDLSAHIAAHKIEIAAALESVLIGSEADRREVESALALMPEDKRAAWLAERHDNRRSSMNNIGERAHKLARAIRGPQNDPVSHEGR
jgi:hypothetical protein